MAFLFIRMGCECDPCMKSFAINDDVDGAQIEMSAASVFNNSLVKTQSNVVGVSMDLSSPSCNGVRQ